MRTNNDFDKMDKLSCGIVTRKSINFTEFSIKEKTYLYPPNQAIALPRQMDTNNHIVDLLEVLSLKGDIDKDKAK